MHDLGAVRLQQAADHVDRRIVAVEQRSGAHEAQRQRRRARVRDRNLTLMCRTVRHTYVTG